MDAVTSHTSLGLFFDQCKANDIYSQDSSRDLTLCICFGVRNRGWIQKVTAGVPVVKYVLIVVPSA